MCCLQYKVCAGRSRISCNIIVSLLELLPWWHAHSCGQRSLSLIRGALKNPGSSRGNSLSHWGKPWLWEASVASGSWLCPSCIAAVGSSCLPKWYCKILAEPVLAAPCQWAIPNMILNPMHSLGCLHHHQPMEMMQPVGIWNEYCFKTSSKPKLVLHCKLTHFQSHDSSFSPFHRRA